MLIFAFFVFSVQIISVISDICTITAICNCEVQNVTNGISGTGGGLSGNSDAVHLNICNSTKLNESTNSIQSAIVLSNPLKFGISCEYVNLKNDSTIPFPIEPNSGKVVLQLNYTCDAPPSPTPDKEHHYSTGTILVIIFFTCIFAYLGMGIAVNYFLIGARGIELIPHISFWKDFPSLVRDGIRFIQNGCKARPSELNATSPDSYDAI